MRALLFVAGVLVCLPVQAGDSMDEMELRFAQANVPASKDELFGAPPARPPKKTEPKSKDDLFGAPPAKQAPKSKDELFGEPKAKPAPATKDELFGAPPAKPEKAPAVAEPMPEKPLPSRVTAATEPGIKWSGYFSEEVAYTTAEDKHWSRAVSRLQLQGQGQLSAGLKYKISARVDADPVYMDSSYYRDEVKDDQDLNFFLQENYLDFSAGDLDFRVGRQQIVWGEVVGLFFADVVSARDMREFLLPSFETMRIPQWAARAEYFFGESHVEFVWIPVQSFDIIGEPGADFYPVPLPASISDAEADAFHDPDEPSRTLSNSSFGLRANTLVQGWDMALFYYRSYNTAPTFYRRGSGGPGDPFRFEPTYDRIWQAGGTLGKDLGDVVLRAEAVYTHGLGFSTNDPAQTDAVVKRPTLDYILSVDLQHFGETRVNVQGFQRVYFGDSDDLALDSGDWGASLLISRRFGNWEPELLWVQTFGGGGGMIRPKLKWYAQSNTEVSFGADIFTGPADGLLGRYDQRDRVYAQVRRAF